MRKVTEGMAVVYVDPVGKERAALVTAVWGNREVGEGQSGPSLNLVWVSDDVTMQDSYGRQVGRNTSIVHKGSQAAPGNYWKFVGE